MNDLRGEVTIILGKKEIILRPTFQVMRVLERKTGFHIGVLYDYSVKDSLTSEQILLILKEALRVSVDGDVSLLPGEKLLQQYKPVVKAFLHEMLGGDESLIFPASNSKPSVQTKNDSSIQNEKIVPIAKATEKDLETTNDNIVEIPWMQLIRIGCGQLKHPPHIFWGMTMKELIVAQQGSNEDNIGLDFTKPAERFELIGLMSDFPDKKKENSKMEKTQ